MNNEQQQSQEQGQKISMAMVLEEYKSRHDNLTQENILQSAYIKQLEKQIAELQNQIQEATTTVEVSDNK